MCGIVGYLGEQNDPKEVIINGLQKLEYRGYDSAGIAVLPTEGPLKRIRAQGKLAELKKALTQEPLSGHMGIGHTRWATHGVPSERNAHPHMSGGICLVHNGIIENYAQIREELLATGTVLESETDTELVAHLIANEVEKTKNLMLAVRNVKSHIRGAYAILVMWDQSPHELVAFKDGPPLVVGIGEGETFVASDVQALLSYTQKFIYLNDQEVIHIQYSKQVKQPTTANFTTETVKKSSGDHGMYFVSKVTLYDSHFEKVEPKVITLNWSADLVEKQGFPHYMLKEIHEQPRAVASAAAPHIDLEKMEVRLKGIGFGGASINDLDQLDPIKDLKNTLDLFSSLERIFVVACGTSYYAAQVAKYLFEKMARIPVETDIASEFRYRDPVLPAKTLLITISQSGETADTLAAIRLAKKLGAHTLSICNVKNSSIDREAHGHLYMNSGPEIGVASTKAFVSTLTVLNLLSLTLAKAKKNLNRDEEKNYLEAILGLPSQMEGVLAYNKYFSEAAQKLKKFKGFLYLGRGVSFPIAMEGALKLKELAYLHAEGYAAGEMKHGPLALIDSQMAIVMVAPKDDVFEKSISNLEETRARGGKVLTLSCGENKALESVSEYYLSLPQAHWSVNPILYVVPLQLMAYHLAVAMGHDVDQPRNLAKSVTVE